MGRHNLRRPLHYTTAPTLYDAPYDAPYDALSLCSGAPNLRPPLPPLLLPPPCSYAPAAVSTAAPTAAPAAAPATVVPAAVVPAAAACHPRRRPPSLARCTLTPLIFALVRPVLLNTASGDKELCTCTARLYLPLCSQMHCALHIMHASCTLYSICHIYAMMYDVWCA